jgi:hypothetical protein
LLSPGGRLASDDGAAQARGEPPENPECLLPDSHGDGPDVVGDPLGEHSADMLLAQRNYPIQTLASNRPDQPLAKRVGVSCRLHRALSLKPPRPGRQTVASPIVWSGTRVERLDRLSGIIHEYVTAA